MSYTYVEKGNRDLMSEERKKELNFSPELYIPFIEEGNISMIICLLRNNCPTSPGVFNKAIEKERLDIILILDAFNCKKNHTAIDEAVKQNNFPLFKQVCEFVKILPSNINNIVEKGSNEEIMHIYEKGIKFTKQDIKVLHKSINSNVSDRKLLLPWLIDTVLVDMCDNISIEVEPICTICQDYMNFNHVAFKEKCITTICNHTFHSFCLLEWSNSNNINAYSCPMCRCNTSDYGDWLKDSFQYKLKNVLVVDRRVADIQSEWDDWFRSTDDISPQVATERH